MAAVETEDEGSGRSASLRESGGGNDSQRGRGVYGVLLRTHPTRNTIPRTSRGTLDDPRNMDPVDIRSQRLRNEHDSRQKGRNDEDLLSPYELREGSEDQWSYSDGA